MLRIKKQGREGNKMTKYKRGRAREKEINTRKNE